MSEDKLLEALYHGEIMPFEKDYTNDRQHRELSGNALRVQKEVYDALGITWEQEKALEDVAFADAALSEYERMDMFLYGFRLGGRLALAMMEDPETL